MSDFKITGPGAYKTRTGCKAEVVGQARSGMWVGYAVELSHWEPSGLCPRGPTEDIIAPWTEPKKGTVWVNVYEIGGACACGYSTRKEADASAGPGRLACVSVNWTEGEGL